MSAALDRAMALHRTGRLAEALTAYQDLLAANPANADALHLTGVLAHQMGRTSTGIACIEHAITLKPDVAVFHRNMAELRKSDGDHAKAALYLSEAIALEPGDANARVELGRARAACGDYAGAVESYRDALAIEPEHLVALTNLGAALQDLGDDEGARAAYDTALALRPDFAPALNNRAAMLWSEERTEDAIALLRKAVAADPDNAEAQVNLGQLLLNRGDLAEGWQRLEARRKIAHALHPPPGVREWTGPGDTCRRLLVCAEQGLGDELMFASCLGDLAAAQPRTTLVVECDPRLAPLFARSLAGSEIRPYRLTEARLRANRRDWLAQAPVDAFVPAGSLPLHFRRQTGDFPDTPAPLIADPKRVAHWRSWLQSLPGASVRTTVGLCWRSGSHGGNRDTTVVPLPAWTPLLASERFSVINLQYGSAGPALIEHALSIGAPVQCAPGLDLFEDLDDVAALIAALDWVVSAGTSVCEMAGALGRPTVRTVRGVDWSMLGAAGTRPWHPHTRVAIGSMKDPAEALVDEVATMLLVNRR